MKHISEQIFINALILTVLLILASCAGLIYIQVNELRTANQSVAHTVEVMDALNQMRRGIAYAQWSQTLKELDYYNTYAEDALKKLDKLTNPSEQNRIAQLKKIWNDQVKDLKIRIANHQNITPKFLPFEFTEIHHALSKEALNQLNHRYQLLNNTLHYNNKMFYVIFILCFLFLTGCLYSLNTYLSKNKKAEEKLRESEEYKSFILQSAMDCIITVNNDFRINAFNKEFFRSFQYSEDELYNLPITDIIPKFEEQLPKMLSGSLIELEGKTKLGNVIPGEISVAAKTINGHVNYICIFRNITSRKRMDKMKDEFISTVSHEVRTPLTVISGAITLLLELPKTKEQNELLELSKRNVQRLTRLINDILSIEKLESGNLEFDIKIHGLDSIVHDTIIDLTTYASPRHIELVYFPDKKNIQVSVDKEKLSQVFINIISNAIKFSPKGSIVTIITDIQSHSVRVSVVDQGPGIPNEFKSKVYDKFAQADPGMTREYVGTGLGLNIAKSFIERMHGIIGYQLNPVKGTTFFIELPIAPINLLKESSTEESTFI